MDATAPPQPSPHYPLPVFLLRKEGKYEENDEKPRKSNGKPVAKCCNNWGPQEFKNHLLSAPQHMHQLPALPRNTLVLRLRALQHARPMGAAANSPRSLGDQPGVGPLRSVVEVAHERLTIEGLAVEIHH